jgi:hypothetical protein
MAAVREVMEILEVLKAVLASVSGMRLQTSLGIVREKAVYPDTEAHVFKHVSPAITH